VSWNADGVNISAGNAVNIFSSVSFPNIILTDTQPLTSDFQLGTTDTTSGFIAPVTGSYQFSMEASIGGTGVIQAYGNFLVDGVTVSSSTFYNYDNYDGTALYPMTDIQTLELTAGDCVSYKVSAAGGSGTINFRYGSMNGTQLTFDATVLGSVDLATLQAETAAATSFADYQARIAAL